MMNCLTRTFPVQVYIYHDGPDSPRIPALFTEPSFGKDALVGYQVLHGAREPLCFRVLDYVDDLVKHVAPRFPADAFSVQSLITLLRHQWLRVEDLEILMQGLPMGILREVRTRVLESGTVEFSGTVGKSSSHVVITFSTDSDLFFAMPVTVRVQAWADMDDLQNHSLDCPQLMPEEDEYHSDDCCCEAEKVVDHQFLVMDPEEFHTGKVAYKIESAVWSGERN
jgi:hypothetical protein